ELNAADSQHFKDAIDSDEKEIANVLLTVLDSPTQTMAILALDGDLAQSVINIIYYMLRRSYLNTREYSSKATRIMGKLARRCYRLPDDLFITGVTQRHEYPQKCGGFGDVFQAMFNGSPVALKRMRMFRETDPLDPETVKACRRLCKEALVWQGLRHKYIVPLIGIDAESFAPAFCMVSPWMKNGTVKVHLKDRNVRGSDPVEVREVAEGLAFLHKEGAIHGDLRGDNILVDEDGHACLTDFGLTVLIDVPLTDTTSGSMGGCDRWKAPEAFQSGHAGRTKAIDIYAFACVCYEVRPIWILPKLN
ncbi:kinase-like domain-containing protein, partial [Mycena amicta]